MKAAEGKTRKSRAHPPERLWDRLDKSQPEVRPGLGPCWVYTGCKMTRGYGQIAFEGRQIGTHKLAWILTHGPVPEGMEVCHRCDNPPCSRPEHLFLGTHRDNMQDAAAKGRTRIKDPAKRELGAAERFCRVRSRLPRAPCRCGEPDVLPEGRAVTAQLEIFEDRSHWGVLRHSNGAPAGECHAFRAGWSLCGFFQSSAYRDAMAEEVDDNACAICWRRWPRLPGELDIFEARAAEAGAEAAIMRAPDVGPSTAGRPATVDTSAPASTARPHDPEQPAELKRVSGRIGPAVLAVLARWCATGRVTFRMSDLHEAVSAEVGGYVAPGSTERIARQLRRTGEARVVLLSRSESLYRIEEVK